MIDNHFGLNHLKSGTAFFGQGSYKSYKYNSKELQETGMYRYGWRDYMPDIGRWNGIDQLAESYLSTSTYAYVANNPVSNADVDGRWFNDDGSIDVSGTANGFVRTRSYSQSYLGQYPGQGGGGGGYTFTGNAAASMFDYFANGGDINGISFNKGWATWSTLDNSNNFMYNDYDSMVTGFTGGVTLHRAKVSNDTSWDAYKNWADWGSTAADEGFKYVVKQRTDLYNNGYWIDNLGQMRSTAYAGRAADSQIGLRSTYLRNTKMFAKYSKRAGYVGYAISAAQIGYGIYEDKGKFGKNSQIATAGVAGGLGGAALGAWAFGKAGGLIGTVIGPEGTAAGAVIGAIVGGFWGGEIAEGWANDLLK
ncbi:RHS repeat-associated core domain-containing protein [uncultured Chryseobacterium sp.]|uniref:RHS repeat-associated core domain-containing protein n=1 Tax=uncultured Chryseobacterium sp. TaxID=259322 RepID=UPI003442E93A